MAANTRSDAIGWGRAVRIAAIACMAGAALAACGDSEPPRPLPPPQIDPPVPLSADELAAVTGSFQCEGGHRVDIVRDQVARIALADGRVALLEVIEGSAPRTYTDNGLTIEVLPDGGVDLSDEDGSRQPCPAAQPPAP